MKNTHLQIRKTLKEIKENVRTYFIRYVSDSLSFKDRHPLFYGAYLVYCHEYGCRQIDLQCVGISDMALWSCPTLYIA